MKNYSSITQESKKLFFKDLQHAYSILKPPETCKDIFIVSSDESTVIEESISIDSICKGCLIAYDADLTRLLMHPFFHFPEHLNNYISFPILYNPNFSTCDTIDLGYTIKELLCKAALLTSFDIIHQILLSKNVSISVFLKYFCEAQNDHYTFATQYHRLCKHKLPKPSLISSDNINDSARYARIKSNLELKITNLQNKTREYKSLLTENLFLQQLLSITSGSPKGKEGLDKSNKALSMHLPLSQYLILTRLLSQSINHLKHILEIYTDNPTENNSRKNIQFPREKISEEMIRYKLGYLSLGNRAFDQNLLLCDPTELKITPEKEAPFFDELLIYQKMESVFHCELTEMMAKKYAEVSKKYIFLEKKDLLNVSFFGIFNNLPNYLTRSIFVNYAFLTLEQICSIKDKNNRSRYIELWKTNCTSFVSELSDIVFPKILWHILIDLFRMSDANFNFFKPKIELKNLAWILQAMDAYIYSHRNNILDPLYGSAMSYKSLRLSDIYEKKAPLRYFKSIIQATDFTRSQRLLPLLS